MILYVLYSISDEVIDELSQDYIQRVKAVSCPKCYDIFPQHRNAPIDVEFEGDWPPTSPTVGMPYQYYVKVVRVDLLSAWRPYLNGFSVGRVFHRGKELSDYRSMVAQTHVRLAYQGNEQSRFYPCPTCGRRCGAGVHPWIRRVDLSDREVYTGITGSSLVLTEAAIDRLSPAILSEIRMHPIPVRDASPS